MAHLQEINQRIFRCNGITFLFSTALSVREFMCNQCWSLTAMCPPLQLSFVFGQTCLIFTHKAIFFFFFFFGQGFHKG